MALTQREQQLQNARMRSNGDRAEPSSDGFVTPPQVMTTVSPLDGELPRPANLGVAFYRKAREMRRDPTTRLARALFMAPLLMAEWEYEATLDAPEGAEQLVKDIMSELRLPLMQSSLRGMCDYGWQPYEVIADQRRDGANGVRLKPLLQDVTDVLVDAADGSFFGLLQKPNVVSSARSDWIYLLDEQCLVVSQDVEGTNWYGEPTLKSVERLHDESELINKSARKYDAKIAGTHWVIYYPLGKSEMGGVTTDNAEVAKRLLYQAEAVGGIVVPRSVVNTMDKLNAALAQSEASQWKIELLSDQGKGQQPFTDRLKYLDVLKVRAFEFPERAILEGQFGTKAEAEAHGDMAVDNLEVRHALLCAQYNYKLLNKCILPWNYGPGFEGCVKIKPSPIADEKKALFEKIYMALLGNPQAFMTEMSSIDLIQLRDRLGLPEAVWQDDPMMQTWDPMVEEQGFSLRSDVDDAADETDLDPSDEQREAGNYRKGRVTIHGLRVCIETPRGEKRKKEWPKLPAHYGYIKRTEGSDGDHVDAFVGKHPESELVVVIDQLDEDGKFDEHKVMLGYKSKKKAVTAYREAYDDGRRPGAATAMTIEQFKEWLRDGDTTEAIALSGFDPNEPRDERGRWTVGDRARLAELKSKRDLSDDEVMERHNLGNKLSELPRDKWLKEHEALDRIRFPIPTEKLARVSADDAGLTVSKNSKAHDATLKMHKQKASAEQRELVKMWTHKVSRGETPIEPGFIRSAERGEKDVLSLGYGKVAKRWNKALDGMPKFEGTVYRGLDIGENSDAFKSLTTTGTEWTNESSESATKLGHHALDYGNVVLRIKSKTGADISHLEKTANREVVLRKGSRYRVIGVQKTVAVDSIEHKKYFAKQGNKSAYKALRATIVDVEEI